MPPKQAQDTSPYPPHASTQQQRNRLTSTLAALATAVGFTGDAASQLAVLDAVEWNAVTAFQLLATEAAMINQPFDTSNLDSSDREAIESISTLRAQANARNLDDRVTDKIPDIEEAMKNPTKLVRVKLPDGTYITIPICPSGAIPDGLPETARTRYGNASIAQKTSRICGSILQIIRPAGYTKDKSEEVQKEHQAIAEAVSSATPLLGAGIGGGREGDKEGEGGDEEDEEHAVDNDGQDDSQAAQVESRAQRDPSMRHMTNLNSFLDLQSDMKTIMGDVITGHYTEASDERDRYLGAIGFQTGHRYLRKLTADNPLNSDSPDYQGKQRKPRRSRGSPKSTTKKSGGGKRKRLSKDSAQDNDEDHYSSLMTFNTPTQPSQVSTRAHGLTGSQTVGDDDEDSILPQRNAARMQRRPDNRTASAPALAPDTARRVPYGGLRGASLAPGIRDGSIPVDPNDPFGQYQPPPTRDDALGNAARALRGLSQTDRLKALMLVAKEEEEQRKRNDKEDGAA